MNEKAILEKKQGRYRRIYLQIEGLLTKTADPVARMATISAILHHKMEGFFWTGFYLLKERDLIVGPYQGPVACQVLTRNQGVCWASVNQREVIIVPDVHAFPGHIACDSRSRSEIAVPVFDRSGIVRAVLDVDSREVGNFDETDGQWLTEIAALVYR
jgi:GAF domain-containing protein